MADTDATDSEKPAETTTSPRRLDPPKLTTDAPVHIHVTSKHKCFIYDVEGVLNALPLTLRTDYADFVPLRLICIDAKKLRLDHHICGTLVGTLPQVAQQNVFLGLPLQLSPEEVSCLVKNGTRYYEMRDLCEQLSLFRIRPWGSRLFCFVALHTDNRICYSVCQKSTTSGHRIPSTSRSRRAACEATLPDGESGRNCYEAQIEGRS